MGRCLRVSGLWLGCLLVVLGLSGCVQIGGKVTPEVFKRRVQARAKILKHSPVGKYLEGIDSTALIVYVAINQGVPQICLINQQEEKPIPKPLTNTPGYKCHPTWNVAHTQIAFFQFANNEPLAEEQATVMLMNADGSNSRELIKNKKINPRLVRISWRPDGSMIYFSETDFPSVLFGYSTDNGEQKETLRLPKKTFLTRLSTVSPDMSTYAGAGPSKHDNIQHVGTIRCAGNGETDLMQPFKQQAYHITTVVWSYDSQLVAFGLDKVVLVMSYMLKAGFELYPITPMDFDAELNSPAFSPGGDAIVCLMEKTHEGSVGSGDQSVNSDLVVMNLDGTKQRQITNTGNCFDPHW